MKAKKEPAKAKATAIKLQRADNKNELGETVPGVGYKIVEIIGSVLLEDKWRAGDSLTEEVAIELSKDTAVVVCC